MGHKRADDSAAALGWYRHKAKHAQLCTCGHAKWRHLGLSGSACTYLGSCPCPAFTTASEKTA